MGNHAGTKARLRAEDIYGRTKMATFLGLLRTRTFILQNWPVSWRLFAVVTLTLVMGLALGGLRVAAAAENAAQFSRGSQLASLGKQVTILVQAMENERDETSGSIEVDDKLPLRPWYNATNAAAAKVQAIAAGIGSSFPADIQARVGAVRFAISILGDLRAAAQSSTFPIDVINDYAVPIGEMISLDNLITQGSSDPGLTNEVQTLNSLSVEKDEVGQQRALLFSAFLGGGFAGAEEQELSAAATLQTADAASFDTTATRTEQKSFSRIVAGPQVSQAGDIEQSILDSGSLNLTSMAITPQAAPALWFSDISEMTDKMQTVELVIARNVVARAQVLQRGAQRSALLTAILTAVIVLLVSIATFAVARSLVLPLRRLRAGALDIATVQLPERVRQLGEAPEPATSLDVAPIDVLSADEIGQVARAFDQVHREAVRLAGNEALLRRSFNAMFISLSRRSQSLIERLARLIDSLEQNEEDPSRLSDLFGMDHLVTRMRRNSENLLLLAGHESARKWTDPVPLSDVARAAVSEIEQYARVAVNIQPGVVLPGHAVSDVTHLLAELIENATVFSPSDSRVLVSAQRLSSGGVLMQVSDEGVGISEARLAEINQRLDDPPTIDISVSRHMGLFAVARLAARHGVRVRLCGTPQGIAAMVWLPDDLVRGETGPYGGLSQLPTVAPAAQVGARMRRITQAAASATSPWFRNRRQPAPGTAKAGSGMPAATGAWFESRQAAPIVTNSVRDGRTVAGMPVRVPGSNLIPGQHGASRPADGHQMQQPPTVLRQRSPETARSRLSGFQRGARRAEGQASRAGEGTDR